MSCPCVAYVSNKPEYAILCLLDDYISLLRRCPQQGHIYWLNWLRRLASKQNYQIRDSIQKTQGIDSDRRSDWIDARKTLKETDSIRWLQSQLFIGNSQYNHKASTKHNRQQQARIDGCLDSTTIAKSISVVPSLVPKWWCGLCIWSRAGLVQCVFVFGGRQAWCDVYLYLVEGVPGARNQLYFCHHQSAQPLKHHHFTILMHMMDRTSAILRLTTSEKNPLLWHIFLIELAHFEMQTALWIYLCYTYSTRHMVRPTEMYTFSSFLLKAWSVPITVQICIRAALRNPLGEDLRDSIYSLTVHSPSPLWGLL